MDNCEMMAPTPAPAVTEAQLAQLPPEFVSAYTQTAQALASMASMMRATNERIAELEREIRLLTKVTPAQANAINAAVRERAAELCASYRATGCEKLVGNAIRRAVKLTTGVSNVRELPRCEYSVAMQQVEMWDDYKAMKAIKAKGANK